MVQAGSMGIPYVPTLGYAGSDVIKRRDDFAIAPDPFNPGEKIVVAKAINPDVALFHGTKGDSRGNVLVDRKSEALMIAQASRRTIVTVEEIVEEVSGDDTSGVFIPGIHVTAVVHAPFGAYPTACDGYYDMDEGQISEYVEASESDEAFAQYLRRYVFEVGDHQGYLQRVGLEARRRTEERIG